MTEDWSGYKAPRPERARPDEAGLIMEEFRSDVAARGPQGLRPEPMPLLGPAAGTVEWADWAETREWKIVHDALSKMMEALRQKAAGDAIPDWKWFEIAEEIAAERKVSGWRTIITPAAIHQHRQEERLKRLDTVLEGEHDGLYFDRQALQTLLMYVDCGLSRPDEAVFYRTPEMRIDELLQANNRLVAQRRELEARIAELEREASLVVTVRSVLDVYGLLDGGEVVDEVLARAFADMDRAREVLLPAAPSGEKHPLGELAQAMASKAADAVNMLGAVDVAAEPLLTVLDFVGMYVADVEPVNGVNVGMLRALRDALNGRPAVVRKASPVSLDLVELAKAFTEHMGARTADADELAGLATTIDVMTSNLIGIVEQAISDFNGSRGIWDAVNSIPQHRYALGDELELFVRIDDVRQVFGVPKPTDESTDPFVIMEREGWATIVTTTSSASGGQITVWQFSHPETGRQCMGHGPDADSARRAAIAQLIAPIFMV